jgi:hypothetical protein
MEPEAGVGVAGSNCNGALRTGELAFMRSFFGAYPAVMVGLLGLGAVWRSLGVGWGLAHVRKLALATAIFAIGVATFNGRMLRGLGWTCRCCNLGLS